MASNILFSFKTVLLFLCLFGGTLWLLDGAPIPMMTVRPIEPSDAIPTFAEAANAAHKKQVAQAAEDARTMTPAERQIDSAAQQFVGTALAYRALPCRKAMGGMVAFVVEDYFKAKRKHPGVAMKPRIVNLPSGEVVLDDEKIESILQNLFQEGMLSLSMFSSDTRAALDKFVRPGSAEKQQYYKNCRS